VNIEVGSQVWVEDPDAAWIDGEVLEVNGDEIKVSCTSGKTVSFSDRHQVLMQVYYSFFKRSPFNVDNVVNTRINGFVIVSDFVVADYGQTVQCLRQGCGSITLWCR